MTPTELSKLPDGTCLVLTQDVKNPHGDRRTKHDWRLSKTLKKGLELVLVKYEKQNEVEPAHTVLRPVCGWRHQDIFLHTNGTCGHSAQAPLYGALLPFLVKKPDTFESLSAFHWVDRDRFAWCVVEQMLFESKLTLEQCEEFYIAGQKRDIESERQAGEEA